MDAMRQALKAKRAPTGGLMEVESEEVEMQPGSGDGAGMAALVKQLSPEQRMELLALLQDAQGSGDKIAEGAPSSEEQGAIAEELENEPSEEVDEMMVGEGAQFHGKPRNLRDRAAQAAKARMDKRGAKA